MAQYRAIVDHVRYWRGTVHRWSTSYEFVGSGATPDTTACNTLRTADSAMCYCPTGTTIYGGIPEVRIYASGGGVPIATNTYFDYTIPADWINYTSTGWPTAVRTSAPDPVAETALLVEWNAGIGRTGKPVSFRKWFHAVPPSPSTGGSPDVGASSLTMLGGAAVSLAACLSPTYGLLMGNARTVAGAATVQPFYGNHQMPRGRRRKALVGADGKVKGHGILVVPDPTYPIVED